ncbi:MAG: gp436 family protein [Polaromonas sp.]
MVYARISDMVERFGEAELIGLSDRDDTGEINDSVLTRALDDATSFIDGHVGRVYQLPLLGCAKPLTTPGGAVLYVAPPVLVRMACDLARYYLYTNVADEHEAVRRYKAAAKDLQAIAEGKTQLTCPWGGAPGNALHGDNLQAQEVFHSFKPRELNDDSLRGFA